MTTGKPWPRLTRSDERALAALLAEADDEEVRKLSLAVNRYESTAIEAKARLARPKALTTIEFFHGGGYRAAMEAILTVICEQQLASRHPEDIVRTVFEVAASAGDLAFVESAVESWARDAS